MPTDSQTLDGQYYLAGMSGMDVFLEMLPGVMTDGATVGYRYRVGNSGFDTVLMITEPPSQPVRARLEACMDALSSLAR